MDYREFEYGIWQSVPIVRDFFIALILKDIADGFVVKPLLHKAIDKVESYQPMAHYLWNHLGHHRECEHESCLALKDGSS